jgi:hypothetical protein
MTSFRRAICSKRHIGHPCPNGWSSSSPFYVLTELLIESKLLTGDAGQCSRWPSVIFHKAVIPRMEEKAVNEPDLVLLMLHIETGAVYECTYCWRKIDSSFTGRNHVKNHVKFVTIHRGMARPLADDIQDYISLPTYWISSRWQTTRGGPPELGLDVGLTTTRRKE